MFLVISSFLTIYTLFSKLAQILKSKKGAYFRIDSAILSSNLLLELFYDVWFQSYSPSKIAYFGECRVRLLRPPRSSLFTQLLTSSFSLTVQKEKNEQKIVDCR